MNISDYIYWAIIGAIILILLFLYLKLKSRKTVGGFSLRELAVIVEAGFFIFLIYMIQVYVFPEHYFFVITIPITVVVWALVIHYLLSGDDIYVLESTIQNEQFYDLEALQKDVTPSTSHRLLMMSREVYDGKKHIGDAKYPFWLGSERVKFTDYYQDDKGIFYHPQLPAFHNVSIHTARLFLLKVKEDVPILIRQNVLLTWLSEYKVAYAQSVLADKFPEHLKALEEQHQHDPFTMPDDLETLYEKKFIEAQRIAKKSENTTTDETTGLTPVKSGGDFDDG